MLTVAEGANKGFTCENPPKDADCTSILVRLIEESRLPPEPQTKEQC